MTRPDLSDIELSEDLYHSCLVGISRHVTAPRELKKQRVQLIWAQTGDRFYHNKKSDWANRGTAVNAIVDALIYDIDESIRERQRGELPAEELRRLRIRMKVIDESQLKKAIYRMIDEGHIEVRTFTPL